MLLGVDLFVQEVRGQLVTVVDLQLQRRERVPIREEQSAATTQREGTDQRGTICCYNAERGYPLERNHLQLQRRERVPIREEPSAATTQREGTA